MKEKDGSYILREKFNIRRTADLLEEGLSNSEIAEKLKVSKSMVRRYIAAIEKRRKDVKDGGKKKKSSGWEAKR